MPGCDRITKTSFLVLIAAAALYAAGPSDRTLLAPATVRAMFFSPDGRSVVAICLDQHIRKWDVASGKILSDRALPFGGYLMNAAMLAEATDKDRKAVRIWDLTADRELQTIEAPLSSAAISPDRKQMAIASSKERSVRLVNPTSGEQRRVLADGIGGPAALVFSPDGSTLISANYDNDVRIWKTQSGELVRKIEDLTGAMFAAEFTPDGKQIVMGGLDETIYIFDAKTFERVRSLKGHGETISALAISPDGRTLVTGGFDVITTANPVKIVFWDLMAGAITRTAHAPHAVSSLAFSPDGQWLAMAAVGGKEITLFSLRPPA